jgi:hypothetical protein
MTVGVESDGGDAASACTAGVGGAIALTVVAALVVVVAADVVVVVVVEFNVVLTGVNFDDNPGGLNANADGALKGF